MARIFISYRRSDAGGYAGRLYDRLSSHFGTNHTFIDVDHIDPGDDFARTIDERMRKADVVLVLIGPRWLTAADADGRARLHLDNDYVRIEIATAIRHNKTVIPVLFEGTAVPSPTALPEELSALATRQGFSCSDERFHADVDRLIAKIEHKSGWFDRMRWAIGRGRRRLACVPRWSRLAAAAGVLGAVAVVTGLQLGENASSNDSRVSSVYLPAPERTTTTQRFPGLSVLAQPAAEDLLGRRAMSDAQQREIVRRYNRTAREIINSIGR